MKDERHRDGEIDFETVEERGGKRAVPPAAALLLVAAAAAVLFMVLKNPEGGRQGDDRVPRDTVETPLRDALPPPAGQASLPPGSVAFPEGPGRAGEAAADPSGVPGGAAPAGSGLPPLDDSAALVETLVRECLGAEPPAGLFGGGSLIRLFVVIVDNLAEGASPRPHLGFLRFAGEFPVVERQGGLYADPAGYRRYDGIARLFASADPQVCASHYRRLAPLIGEAYRDLGYPDRPFEEVLRKAIGRVTALSLPEGDVRLVEGVGAYHFEDPALEALDSLEKHVIRMGPRNAALVRRALGDFAAALQ